MGLECYMNSEGTILNRKLIMHAHMYIHKIACATGLKKNSISSLQTSALYASEYTNIIGLQSGAVTLNFGTGKLFFQSAL